MHVQTMHYPHACAVEREWTKALCGSDSEALAQLNAAMKRIDLTCLIASPILVGLVMQVRWMVCVWEMRCGMRRFDLTCALASSGTCPADGVD